MNAFIPTAHTRVVMPLGEKTCDANKQTHKNTRICSELADSSELNRSVQQLMYSSSVCDLTRSTPSRHKSY